MNLILFVVTIVSSYVMFKTLAGSMALTKLNLMSTIYYYNIIFLTLIGSYAIAEGFGDNPVLNLVSERNRQNGYIAILYSIFAFCLAAAATKKLLIGNVSSALVHSNYFERPIVSVKTISEELLRGWLYFLTIVCFSSAIYVTIIKGSIPQFSFFTLDDQVGNLLSRVSFERDFPGIIYIKTVFFEQVTVLLSLVIYCFWLMTRRIKDYLWFLMVFVLSVYSVTFSLSKSQLVVYLSYFLFITIYSKGGISKKYFISFLSCLSAILVFFFIIVTKMDSEALGIYMLNRMFLDQISGTFLMMEIFPNIYNYIGICSLSNLIPSYFCESTEPATRLAMEYAFPHGSFDGLMNLLSTYYLGEAWANFGYLGILIAPLYLGFIISFFYFFMLSINKNPFSLALMAFVSFGTNFSSQFNSYIYNMLFFVTTIIVMLPLIVGFLFRRQSLT